MASGRLAGGMKGAALALTAAFALALPASAQTAKPASHAAIPAPAGSSAPAAPAPSPKPAAPTSAPPATGALDVGGDQQILTRLQNQLPSITKDDQLAAMGRRAAAIEAAADGVLAARDAELAKAYAALRRYPFDRKRRLTKAQQQQKAALEAEASGLLPQVAQVQALASEASRTFSLIAERRRESFTARVFAQTSSPLSPDFWTSLADSAGSDLGRLEALIAVTVSTAWSAAEPKGLGGLAVGAIIALTLIVVVRRWLILLGWRACQRLALGGAGRTLAIVWTTAVDVGGVALAAGALRLGLQWGGLLAPGASLLAQACVSAAVWAAAVNALGRALATDEHPDRRLLKVDDAQARRLRLALWVVALITAAGLVVQRLNFIAGASLAATIASDCAVSLAYAVGMGLLLLCLARGDEAVREGDGESAAVAEPARAPGQTLIALLLAGAMLVTIGAVLLGYSTLASLISGQVFWLALTSAVAFLALRLIDDVCGAAFREHSRPARALSAIFGLRISTVVQLGLLLSAALQLAILLIAVGLSLTPFGQSGELLMAHIRALGGAIQIGKATISPLAIAAGLGAFAFGMSLVHLARGWVVRRYLPATHWDAGVRNSVATGVGYVGAAVALTCALAVTGLGFKQIALVASALSVGIGFGLQQVVQNFVAGIILLIERPVKVGDWISVSGVEGDVQRIRVRATEIRTFDRSTVIVPNSNLITTNVQNRNLGDPRARIQLKLTIAKPADVHKARDEILKLLAAQSEVLREPEPAVYIDGLATAAGGGVELCVSFYLLDPRQATRVKSELYFGIVDAFAAAGIAFL